jgi:hypothetical protein
VRNLEDRRGKPGRWVIGEPLPEAADLLPDPAQLRNTAQPPDKDRCGVAPDSDRERDAATPAAEVADTREANSRVNCEACGDPLLNLIQRARGLCGPCVMRRSA